MNTPVQITFRHMDVSEALSAQLRERAAQLEEYCDKIQAVRVVVEAPHQHHRQGNHFRVAVTVEVPGEELVADRDPPEAERTDAYLAAGEAFRAMRRQVQEYARRSRSR